jgi:uncharacterized protein
MPLFLIIIIAVIAISFFVSRAAGQRFKTAMARAQNTKAPFAHSGAEIAQKFLASEDIHDVEIVRHQGIVTDYFDPQRRRLFLSRRTEESTSLAAWAIALHEAAHATQTDATLGDLKWRQNCIRLSRYLPTLMFILLGVAALFKVLHPRIALLIFGGVWAILFLLNLGSLAIEWNANLRLRRFLDRHLADYPDAREQLDRLLATVATRELGDQVDSPRFFFLSALPGSSKLRPSVKPTPPQDPPS